MNAVLSEKLEKPSDIGENLDPSTNDLRAKIDHALSEDPRSENLDRAYTLLSLQRSIPTTRILDMKNDEIRHIDHVFDVMHTAHHSSPYGNND